jgi:hypothetical protein
MNACQAVQIPMPPGMSCDGNNGTKAWREIDSPAQADAGCCGNGGEDTSQAANFCGRSCGEDTAGAPAKSSRNCGSGGEISCKSLERSRRKEPVALSSGNCGPPSAQSGPRGAGIGAVTTCGKGECTQRVGCGELIALRSVKGCPGQLAGPVGGEILSTKRCSSDCKTKTVASGNCYGAGDQLELEGRNYTCVTQAEPLPKQCGGQARKGCCSRLEKTKAVMTETVAPPCLSQDCCGAGLKRVRGCGGGKTGGSLSGHEVENAAVGLPRGYGAEC